MSLSSCRWAKNKKATLYINNNNNNKLYFKRITVNPDKSMAIYNKLQIISVTGKENKIVTRLSTVYYWNKKSYNDYMQQRLKL